MKKLVVGIVALLSLSAFAQNGTKKIAQIKERGTDRTLVYTQDGKNLIFTVKDGSFSEDIKTLKYQISAKTLELAGDNDTYKFEFLSKMKNASSDAYHWCWTVKNPSRGEFPDFTYAPAGYGAILFGVGLVVTVPLCAVVPGVPFILGAILSPIDGVITVADNLFDADAVAARKFSRLLKGKNKTASKDVFNSIVHQISAL